MTPNMRVMEELEFAWRTMKQLGCPVIDVTEKAIEETASIILSFKDGCP